MQTFKYFINQKNIKNEKATNLITEAIQGEDGVYASLHGENFYEKEMVANGWKLAELTDTEYQTIIDFMIRRCETQILAKRAQQVDICLKSEALPIINSSGAWVIGKVVSLGNTPMIDAYHGVGKGTAYVKGGKLIAFHYGYHQPENAPDAEKFHVVFSARQVLFLP